MNPDVKKGWRVVGALVVTVYVLLFVAGMILEALNAGAF